MNLRDHHRRALRLATVIAATGIALGACGSSSNGSSTPSGATATSSAGATSRVLPVTDNPITNTSTTKALKIDSVLVENNVDPATGKATDDHLEIALTNTGGNALSGFEVYYTFTDATTNATESYYLKLPDTFTIAPGASRTAHFDNTGALDHFPVNQYSLYNTSTNALDVTVVVSAPGAAVRTATIQKDAGGPEEAD
ncbi:MAG: hypothetical protein M5T61_04200 [Acidimicrobiia bacterium]|nr:hypothetical protein [Acidimicrobiia bacterium]